MLLPWAALVAAQTGGYVPNAKLGVPYMLGGISRVIGSGEVLDLGSECWVTLNTVRTALRFAGRQQTFVASEGEKLILLHCTVKNPSKVVAKLSESFLGWVAYEPKGSKAKYEPYGAVDDDLNVLNKDLKKGEAASLTLIIRAPAMSPTIWIGLYYGQAKANKRRYDLAKSVKKTSSVFSKDGIVYADQAEAGLGSTFDFGILDMKVVGAKAIEDQGVGIDVEVTNPNYQPVSWGWQYASATLTTQDGANLNYYPELIDTATGKPWGSDIEGGRSITLRYRFYPKEQTIPAVFRLTAAASKRSVSIRLSGSASPVVRAGPLGKR